MIPYIDLYIGKVPSFVVFIIFGVLSFIITTELLIKESANRFAEENYIFPKIVFSGMTGLGFAALYDALFKLPDNHKLVFKGISFYGGLIGASISLFVLTKIFYKNTQYSTKNWFNILTRPMIIFHFWGRMGCFFAGCCFGKVTDSILGVAFPDNASAGIYHGSQRCYPTQLFECASLLIILIVTCIVKEKFNTYILLYSFARFIIEFFRGDYRGIFIDVFSPAQLTSIFLFTTALINIYFYHIKVFCKNIKFYIKL